MNRPGMSSILLLPHKLPRGFSFAGLGNGRLEINVFAVLYLGIEGHNTLLADLRMLSREDVEPTYQRPPGPKKGTWFNIRYTALQAE